MKKTLSAALALAVFAAISLTSFPVANADDSTATQAHDRMDDAHTSAKKNIRKGKKDVRKATGTDTATRDAKDTMNNAKDDVSNSAKKADRDLSH